LKRRYLILPFLTFILILIFALVPVSFISANPVNLVKNGDFSDGSDYWFSFDSIIAGGEAIVGPDAGFAFIQQIEIETPNKNLTYNVDVFPVTYGSGGYFEVAFRLKDGGADLGWDSLTYNTLPTGDWTHISFKLSDAWSPLPDFFDEMEIWLRAFSDCQVYCDNFSLKAPKEEVWVRDSEMKCKQVWVNEDNNFQFSFIYPYADNNWVRIYDMQGNMVYEIDMPLDNPNIIVDLPDGMYTVKTFHDQIAPIQEFVIGKP